MSCIKVRVTFTDGHRSWSVPGLEVPYERIAFRDLDVKIAETEAHLARITGLVVKIETGDE